MVSYLLDLRIQIRCLSKGEIHIKKSSAVGHAHQPHIFVASNFLAMVWATREQKAFLIQHWDDYRAASDDGSLTDFWPVIFEAWFSEFPETDNLGDAFDTSSIKPKLKTRPPKTNVSGDDTGGSDNQVDTRTVSTIPT
jgi:hypothetical protein